MLKSVSVIALAAAMSCSLFVGGASAAQPSNSLFGHGKHHNYRPPNRPSPPYRPGNRPGHDWRGHHHHRGHGGAVAAGMAGLFIGAAIANSNRYDPPPAPIPYDDVGPYTTPYAGRDWHSYCAAKYSTYNPRDGMYLAVDGRRYPCH